MGLNVEPTDLTAVADRYAELSQRMERLGPEFLDQVRAVQATHGTMGFPVVAGTLAAALDFQEPLEEMTQRFSTYAQRFDEAAGEYRAEDRAAALSWREGPFLFGEDGPGDDEDSLDDDDGDGAADDDVDRRAQAEHDVHQVLAGEASDEELARVRQALTLDDQQQADLDAGRQVRLTPAQMSYLSQMQAQQHGMKLRDLRDVEQGLGDDKNLIADSWQLMSNPQVSFDKTELTVGALDNPEEIVKGGFAQLPESVQHGDLRLTAAMVEDGSAALQHNTELDRHLLVRADTATDDARFEDASRHAMANKSGERWHESLHRSCYLRETAEQVFSAVTPDHYAIHDAVTGEIDGLPDDKFLWDITHTVWPDHGDAAGALFSWTHDAATGAEAQIAGKTAHDLSAYLGAHGKELNHLPIVGFGLHSLGELNPELVRDMAHGLVPYVNNISGVSGGPPEFGEHLDDGTPIESGVSPVAKGVFSVLNTDESAAEEFNGAAYARAILEEREFALHPHSDSKPAELFDSATLRGLVDVGVHNAVEANTENGYWNDVSEYETKKAAYQAGVSILGATPYIGPGLAALGAVLENDIVGPSPELAAEHNMDTFASSRADAAMLNTLRMLGYETEISEKYLVPDTRFPWEFLRPNLPERMLTVDEVVASNGEVGAYQEEIARALKESLGFDFQSDFMKEVYDNIVNDPRPSP